MKLIDDDKLVFEERGFLIMNKLKLLEVTDTHVFVKYEPGDNTQLWEIRKRTGAPDYFLTFVSNFIQEASARIAWRTLVR